MKPGDNLVDVNRGQTSYRVEGIAASGRRHQIAELYDESNDRPVVGRVILYGDEADTDPAVEWRRSELDKQRRFLEQVGGVGVVPKSLDWIETAQSPVERDFEPVLICEKIEGPSLYDWIVEEHPQGLEPKRALELLGGLVESMGGMHEAGWLWRDFDPRRFRIDARGTLRAASIGCVIEVGEPVPDSPRTWNADYVAPELRGEVAVKMQRPAGDLYGLGALLSFAASGEEPRHRVESPLSYDAYERIEEHGRAGLPLLLARLLQPMASKRLESVEALKSFWDVESLPTRKDDGFENCELPAPWLGLDIDNPKEHRGLRSSLSAGPLVSMQGNGEASSERAWDWRLVAAVVVATLVVVAAGIWVAG